MRIAQPVGKPQVANKPPILHTPIPRGLRTQPSQPTSLMTRASILGRLQLSAEPETSKKAAPVNRSGPFYALSLVAMQS